MRRREFITLLGGAAATWPMAARAQQPAIPSVGFLSIASPQGIPQLIADFRNGLKDTGFVDGQNVTVEFRWAEGHDDRLPQMAAELVRRKVAVIVAIGPLPAMKAMQAAGKTVPVVFTLGGDPVKLGLVASLNRPGGNITGVSMLNSELASKRLELLHEMAPKATNFAFLVNPGAPTAQGDIEAAQAAAQALGIGLAVVKAGNEHEIDAAFATLAQPPPHALVVHSDPYLTSQRGRIVPLVARLAISSIHSPRDWVVSGALMSYGTNTGDSYRQAGVYAGRILKGEKPSDLPVVRPTKFELVINLKTAGALKLDVPPKLLALADEVIE